MHQNCLWMESRSAWWQGWVGARPILTNHPKGHQGTRGPPASKLPDHQIPVDSEKNMKKYYCWRCKKGKAFEKSGWISARPILANYPGEPHHQQHQQHTIRDKITETTQKTEIMWIMFFTWPLGVFGVEKTEMAGRMITSSSPTVFAYLSANHHPAPSHTYEKDFEMPNSLQFTEFMFFFKCDYSRNIDQGMD